jgi:hypothetical protein
LGYLLLVCKISAQYVNFYLVFIDSEKNNFSADVYVHLAGGGLSVLGNARNILRNAGPDRHFYNLDYLTGTGPEERQQLINQVVELLDSEDCSGILEYPVNIDHDVFFK